MKVSVIIPAYNRGALLIQALESLLEQDCPRSEFEAIVVDNNSRDNTAELVKDFAEKNKGRFNLKYVLETRQGDIYARHSGAALAEGEILAFTDDDATFDTNWVSEIARMFDAHPEMGALGTNILIVWDREPQPWVKKFERFLGKIEYDCEPFVQQSGLYINNGALAIRKGVFYKVGGNNPGQIGPYLVGDAEVGLCRKLHNLGIPIGFTGRTTMWHHQKEAVNGQLKDIKRRAANNGISKAYTDIYYNGGGSRISMAKAIIVKDLLIVKDILCRNREKLLNARIGRIEDKFHYIYLRKIKTDPELVKMQNNRDWYLDDNYVPPPVLLEIKADL